MDRRNVSRMTPARRPHSELADTVLERLTAVYPAGADAAQGRGLPRT